MSLVFLLLNGPLHRLAAGRGRDAASRLLKGGFFVALPLLAFFPALTVETPGPLFNIVLLIYIVLFSLFCYYMGKRSGWTSGRKELSDFVGLDTPDDVEDVQDRLFESRLRFPVRSDVVASIAALARARQPEQPGDEQQRPGGAESAAPAQTDLRQ